jgi:hypothetical protein
MKKRNVINLIKYYADGNDSAFRNESYEIAKEFNSMGDTQLAEYIMALLSDVNTFVPQINSTELSYFQKVEPSCDPLPLPEALKDDVLGIVNAVGHNAGINKFLFEGNPGTGKTETVKQLARILERDLFMVNFESIVDSKLGQTSKNISSLFTEIQNFVHPEKVIILFDEIDAIALDRVNMNDIREMGRATSAILKGLDNLNEKIVLIATTNLFDSCDKALLRRFDSIINFNRYSQDDLLEVAESIMSDLLRKFNFAGRNMILMKKILKLWDKIPYPGELKNVLKTAIAFSKQGDEFDYLKRLYKIVSKNTTPTPDFLRANGFTIREIEIMTGISKSKLSREFRMKQNE